MDNVLDINSHQQSDIDTEPFSQEQWHQPSDIDRAKVIGEEGEKNAIMDTG